MSYCYTYSLGFFFGPGRPLSLIGPFGSIEGGARFRPFAAGPPLLRLLSTLGGASELWSAASLLAEGTGVAFDSDVFPVDSGGCIDGVVSIFGGCADGLGVTSEGKRDRCSGERRNVIIRLFLAVFDVDLVMVVVADIMDDGGMSDG